VRKYFRETKLITTVTFFSILIAIGIDFSSFRFKGIISNVCYSIIAAYIFYLIQIYFPERKKKRLLAARIRGFFSGKILDELSFITRTLDNNTRESLSEEYAGLIIESATEAYNNLFKCTDDFGQLIDDDILDVVVGLTESQFLYDLYYLRHYLDEEYSNCDAIFDSYEEYGDDFRTLRDRLGKLVSALPLYGQELSDDINIKNKANHT